MSDCKYFSNCPIYGFELHATAEKAQERAKELIQDHIGLDRDWSDVVEQVCWGTVEEIATKTNVQTDETGEFDYICEYELKKPD